MSAAHLPLEVPPEVPIVRLAARGDGLTADGRHIAGAAPGDVIAADGSITAGPHRAAPPCRHFGDCGGCQLQHVDDAAFVQFLIDRIAGALADQRLTTMIAPPHLSPARTRRRATWRTERRGRQVVIGFNASASHRIVDQHECHVLVPALFALVAPLRRLLAVVLADRARATVTATIADNGIDLLITGDLLPGLATVEALSAFATQHALARLSIDDGDGPRDHHAPDPVTITLSGVPVALPIAAFLQATADGEAALVALVRRVVDEAGPVADLFAGLGTFALALGGRVFAVEGSRDAAAALAATRRVQVAHRDLFRRPLTVPELAPFAAVVLDPPRAGASGQAAELAGSAVPTIAYVSCNPATFARDARTLVDGGYSLTGVTPVGQFRWSTHVELVGRFVRA